jgi:hypothetical protein
MRKYLYTLIIRVSTLEIKIAFSSTIRVTHSYFRIVKLDRLVIITDDDFSNGVWMMDESRKIISEAQKAVEKNRAKIDAEWNEKSYTKSIVAFIDICGTKNFFLDSPDDFGNHKETYKKLHELIQRIHTQEQQMALEYLYGEFPIKATMVSDGIVLSIDSAVQGAFDKIFMITGLFIRSLLELAPPRFMRGAITVGNIYHEQDIVFGSALVEAAILEKDVAKNYRCVIKKEHLDEIANMKNCNTNIIEGFFHESNNSIYYFDYLYRFLIEVENMAERNYNIDEYKAVLARLGAYLKEAKNNEMFNDSVKKKYVWMYDYYHATLQRGIMRPGNEFLWLKDEYQKWKQRKS